MTSRLTDLQWEIKSKSFNIDFYVNQGSDIVGFFQTYVPYVDKLV